VDPLTTCLLELEKLNKLCCCNLLSAKCYDGDQFRMDAPRIDANSTSAACVTVPNTRARQDAIQKSKPTTQLFHRYRTKE
jgi:hypothetical protein